MNKVGIPLSVILIVDSENRFVDYDFAWHENNVWHSFGHGDITGATRRVVWSYALPEIEEVLCPDCIRR